MLLIVNTASKCGFTPQYKGLEAVYKKMHARGLDVLGFPCNQFGAQEPGSEDEIESFCEINYGVTFPLFAKVDVNGDNAAPLYQYLKKAKPGVLGSEAIKWNFTKFLVDRNGNVVERYAPNVEPEAIAADIEKLLVAADHRWPGAHAHTLVAVVAMLIAAFARRRRMPPTRTRCCASPSCPRRPASIRRPRATSTRTTSIARSSIRCTGTIIWRGRTGSLPTPRRRCRRFRPTGKTWTIKVKPGIYFADDPAFKGNKRELTAADYVYSWKRVIDPKMRSPNLQQFDGKFEGADASSRKPKETGKFDYDAPVEGLQASIATRCASSSTAPSYDLLADLTTSTSGAVAREVIEAYGDGNGWAMANPVGTGPYRLKEWRRGQQIVLEANPDYRDVLYPGEHRSGRSRDHRADAREEAAADRTRRNQHHRRRQSAPARVREGRARLRGRAARADVERARSRQQAERRGSPRLACSLRAASSPRSYTFFNMDDPVVGGYTNDKVALRRAIGMAYNIDEERSASCDKGRRCPRRSRCRRTSPAMTPSSTARQASIRRVRGACSTSSATSTATATAGATCPTASRSSCTCTRRSARSNGSTTSCGSAA